MERVIPELMAATENWETMTQAERAVAVAKDVQLLLTAERIEAESGTYLRAKVGESCSMNDDLRAVLLDTPKCQVCAVGALFVAKIAARNGALVGDQCEFNDSKDIRERDPNLLRDSLADAFTRETLWQIEAAFEDGWDREYPNDRDRLDAIMQRVIENNGTFTYSDANEFGGVDEAEEDDEDEDDWDDDDDDDYYDDEEDDDWEEDEDDEY